jgi:hypothetical protein
LLFISFFSKNILDHKTLEVLIEWKVNVLLFVRLM